MKKNLLFSALFIFAVLSTHNAHSQNPLVKQWDYRYGGLAYDNLTYFQTTSDGGYILGGWTNSGIGGDKTEDTIGSYDYWIVKLNSSGLKEWDKNFGGTGDDYFHVVIQTSDGGFLLGGTSNSPAGGDKTQDTWSNSFDFWIVKTDSSGNKLWDKNFGGTSTEYLNSFYQTNDGGYILGGSSNSGISGDKTQVSKGLGDYWIIKTDAAGNKLWDKDLGGNSDEILNSVVQTTDGGYMLGGHSSSGISGDKSQASWGNSDYWIVKTDASGIKEWDKDFGGNSTDYLYDMEQTSDNGYILGGISISGISGDKSEPTWGGGADYDFWIIKTDSSGIKQWDKDLGGTGSEDEFGNITQTFDGGFVMGGNSYSNLSGDKSENNLGQEQTWVVKVDPLGNKQWDKTLLTGGHDETGFSLQTNDGCFAMANFTGGGIAGDKTQTAYGQSDYWIIKFCDTTQSQIPVAAFTSPNHICPGTCTDFTNLSFNATSYQWFFPGGNPSLSTAVSPTNICYNSPGSYDITLIATNGVTSDTLVLSNYITVYPFPLPQGILQSGDTLLANAGASSYQWFLNGIMISGATSSFYVASQSGDYSVVATDINGCEVEAVIFNVIASLNPVIGHLSLVIYSDPVEGMITLVGNPFDGTSSEISIYNVLGEKVIRFKCESNVNGCRQIDCSQLSSGTYILELVSGEKSLKTKFMKQ